MKTDPYHFEKPVLALDDKIRALEAFSEGKGIDVEAEVGHLRKRQEEVIRRVFQTLEPWDKVNLARHPGRPQTSDYVDMLLTDFVELRGDRAVGDDKAILTGFGMLGDQKILLVGHRKGRSTAERMECNFGMAHPEGYRKALAKMRLAEKFGIPVVTMINTPGAYPGVGAEERGQAAMIATNIYEMARLRTPIVCVVISEGGSGGAMGIGVGDRLLMLEFAYYSVISPEGCAAILWKDGAAAPKAAEALKLTSSDLERLELVDEVVAEPLGGAHRNPTAMGAILKKAILRNLSELTPLSPDRLVEMRYDKLRLLGNKCVL